MEEGSGTASVGGHTIKVVPVAASSTARVVTTNQVGPRVISIPSLFHMFLFRIIFSVLDYIYFHVPNKRNGSKTKLKKENLTRLIKSIRMIFI